MNVVFVSQVFYPDNQATSQLFTDLLHAWSSSVNSITVITGVEAIGISTKLLREEFVGNLCIKRCGWVSYYKRNYWRRVLGYLGYFLCASGALWKLRRADLVITVTNPPVSPIWMWALQKLFIRKYAVIMHDLFPDGLVAVNKLHNASVVTAIWRFCTRKSLEGAQNVMVIGRDMASLIQRTYSIPAHQISYIPHWSSYTPKTSILAESTNLCSDLNLEGKFIVQYSGNMGLWHDIDSVVKAASHLSWNLSIHFLMIGDGQRKKCAQDLAAELHLTNITWLPFQPKESLSDTLNCSHVSLVSQRNGLTGIAVPSKLYGILASGRPIIAMVPPDSEVAFVVKEEQCGMVIPPGDSQILSDSIMGLFLDQGRRQQMGQNAFEAYLAKYTLLSAVSKFSVFVNSAISRLQ